MTNTPAPKFSALKDDIAVDVLVVGAGITGITAAYLLKRAGFSVALVEKDRCLSGETSFTTAHLTCVTDALLSELVKNFGQDHAQAVWDSQLAAIDMIDRIVWREQIKCQFDWVPAHLFNPSADRPEQASQAIDLQEEARLASELGFDAEPVSTVPVFNTPGVHFANQAKFHPRKYLIALLRLLTAGKGCQVYETTEIEEIEGTPITATTSEGHRIHCEHVLIATHVPLQGRPDCLSHRAAIEARALQHLCRRRLGAARIHSEGLYWTPAIRTITCASIARTIMICDLRRRDHKTGQVEDTTKCFTRSNNGSSSCCRMCRSRTTVGQVIETTTAALYRRDRAASVCRDRLAGNG